MKEVLIASACFMVFGFLIGRLSYAHVCKVPAELWVEYPYKIPQDTVVTQYLVYYRKSGYNTNQDGEAYSVVREQIDILSWWPNSGFDTGHITQTKFTDVTVLYWMPLPREPK